MSNPMITVKILKDLQKKSRKYIGPLKRHRNFVDIVNHALNNYLITLEEEGKNSE